MYQKYLKLRNSLGVTDYRVCISTGVSTATMSNWKKHFETKGAEGYQPKMDKVKAIADYFHVPLDYFLEEEKEGRS